MSSNDVNVIQIIQLSLEKELCTSSKVRGQGKQRSVFREKKGQWSGKMVNVKWKSRSVVRGNCCFPGETKVSVQGKMFSVWREWGETKVSVQG